MKEGPMLNEQIEEIRREVEKLLAEPEFEEMTRTFQHALAQRLGLEDFEEGGLVVQAPTPTTLKGILNRAGITDLEQLRAIDRWPDAPYSYGNIYTYHFW
jgi:hypothetical protein